MARGKVNGVPNILGVYSCQVHIRLSCTVGILIGC